MCKYCKFCSLCKLCNVCESQTLAAIVTKTANAVSGISNWVKTAVGYNGVDEAAKATVEKTIDNLDEGQLQRDLKKLDLLVEKTDTHDEL